jgi:hypothetical protein
MIMSLYEGRLQGCRSPADGSLEIVRDGSGWVTVRIFISSLAALGDRQLDAAEARRAGADLLSPRMADDLRRILPPVPRVSRKDMAAEDLAALRRLRDLAGWE